MGTKATKKTVATKATKTTKKSAKATKTATKTAKKASKATEQKFDCSKCSGYCCSYTIIGLSDDEAKKMAKDYGLSFATFKKRHLRHSNEDGYYFVHRDHEVHGSICQFYVDGKGCSVYDIRPSVCRIYPRRGGRCSFYDFITDERKHSQDDKRIVGTRMM